MNIDELNEKQNKAMADLRERIENRKRLAAVENSMTFPSEFEMPIRELRPLPEITIPPAPFGEFSYERFIQVQERLDVAYCNFLCEKERKDFNVQSFEIVLKELIQTVDLYVAESLRPRY